MALPAVLVDVALREPIFSPESVASEAISMPIDSTCGLTLVLPLPAKPTPLLAWASAETFPLSTLPASAVRP